MKIGELTSHIKIQKLKHKQHEQTKSIILCKLYRINYNFYDFWYPCRFGRKYFWNHF